MEILKKIWTLLKSIWAFLVGLFSAKKELSDLEVAIEKVKSSFPTEYIDILTNKTDAKIIYGYVQTIKSEFLMYCIWWIIFVEKKLPVLILMNRTASLQQVKTRDINDFNKKIDSIFGEVNSDLHIKSNDRSPILTNEFVMGLNNIYQLRKLNTRLKNSTDIVLLVDEADTTVSSCESIKVNPVEKEFEKIRKKSTTICYVTATIFAILNERGSNGKCFRLKKPKNYRGIDEIIHHDISEKCVPTKVLQDLLANLEPTPFGYRSVLVNTTTRNNEQEELAKKIKIRFRDKLVYVHNSNSKISEVLRHNNAVTVKICKNYATIGDIYDAHERHRVKKDFIIVSGEMANRAISFRPSSRKIGSGGLSGMLYIPSETAHGALIMQSMRIFGIYDPDYPPIHLYTTKSVYHDIKMTLTNFDEWIAHNQEYSEKNKLIDNRQILRFGPQFAMERKCDRPSVDDIVYPRKDFFHRIVFVSIEEAKSYVDQYFPNRFYHVECLAVRKFIEDIKIENWKKAREDQANTMALFRAKLCPGFSNREIKVQIGYDDTERIERLNDIVEQYKLRQGRRSNYYCDYAISNGKSLENIPYIQWHHHIEFTLDSCDYNTLYYIETTTGQVKVYFRNVEHYPVGEPVKD